MWNRDARLVVRESESTAHEVPVSGPGTYDVGPCSITLDGDDGHFTWSVTANRDTRLNAVELAFDVGPAGDDPRLFAHGYQSWSPSGARRLGIDADPSRDPRSVAAVRSAFHADPSVVDPGELRSELVTVVDRGNGALLGAGFDGGRHHEGTFRVRLGEGRVALRAQAWLGGAVLPAGTARDLHGVRIERGDDPAPLLEAWADAFGRAESARIGAPYTVGWCSWYHYFHDVSERAVLDNLARATEWPFDVFQLDDGYQSEIGDWLTTNERFPAGLESLARAIDRAGCTPGIWIAPFLAAPASRVAREHPGWLARTRRGAPLVGMYHENWGGSMWELDTTRPDVREHLATTARALVAAGFRYLKLDFTFSPTMPGVYDDARCTPAERVRLGYEAIREGAGDEAFILACGCPLGAVVGVVDAMRIGPDVAPSWTLEPGARPNPGYEAAAPSTRGAYLATVARAFQHRRLWSNDPDCLMLRTTDTALSREAARAWALAVGISGGLALVSDDLALLGPDERALLDQVLLVGRAADAAARAGSTPRGDGLLDPDGPRAFAGPAGRLEIDLDDPRPRFSGV